MNEELLTILPDTTLNVTLPLGVSFRGRPTGRFAGALTFPSRDAFARCLGPEPGGRPTGRRGPVILGLGGRPSGVNVERLGSCSIDDDGGRGLLVLESPTNGDDTDS